MKISFLVTYYNQEKYVKSSIDSILAINKPCEWEILIGDDGSDDRTVDIVKEYISKYPDNIKLFIMPREKDKKYLPIKRASANRINLLEHATGDYFCTLDGDDFYFDENFVADALQVFGKHENASAVCYGYADYSDGTYKQEHTLTETLGFSPVNKDVYLSRYYIHAGACVHKVPYSDTIKRIKELGYFDDNDILINSIQFGEMFYTDRCIYAYRQEGDGIFTGVSKLERSLLNTLTYDVENALTNDSFNNLIFQRYFGDILKTFLLRKKIKSTLGNEKFAMYLALGEDFPNSLYFSIMNYNNINKSAQTEMFRLLIKGAASKSIQYIKSLFLKH